MAVRKGTLSLKIKDDNGAVASTAVQANIDDSATLLVALNDLQNWAGAVDPVIGGVIEKAYLTIEYDPTSVKSDPVAGSDITQTGTFNFTQSGNPYLQGVVLPSIADSKVVGGKIDLTDTDVNNLVDFITTAHTAITIVGRVFSALVALVDALFSFRKRRKAISRRSFPA